MRDEKSEIEKQEDDIDEVMRILRKKRKEQNIKTINLITKNTKDELDNLVETYDNFYHFDSTIFRKMMTEYYKYWNGVTVPNDEYDESKSKKDNYAAGMLHIINILTSLQQSSEESKEVEDTDDIMIEPNDYDIYLFKTKDGRSHIGKYTYNSHNAERFIDEDEIRPGDNGEYHLSDVTHYLKLKNIDKCTLNIYKNSIKRFNDKLIQKEGGEKFE